MNIRKRIIEYFYPFTDNQNDFVLINKPTWYSNIYRNILFSGNGGKTFEKIFVANEPLSTHGNCVMEYNWTFEPKTFNAETCSFDKFRKKFKSVKDIRDFEEEEFKRYTKGKEEVRKLREEYINRIHSNIK